MERAVGRRWRAAASALSVLAAVPLALAAQTPVQAQLQRADSLFTAGAHAEALRLYEAVRAAEPGNSRAVFRVAVLRSWRDELDVAIALHRQYLTLEPNDLEGRIALGRVLAWDGRFPEAVAQYDTVLQREPDYRDAAMGRGLTLGWWGRFAEADAGYAAWIAAHPTDTAAVLDRARVLSWAGQLDAALLLYERYAGSVEAEKGAARVRTWKGDLIGGEARWERLTQQYPRDPEVWVGLGQVRRWLGRPRPAREALQQALQVAPGYEDARQQLRWVNADLRPNTGVDLTLAEDSDGNRMVSVTASAGATPPWGRRATLSFTQRETEFGLLRATAQVARGAWGVQSRSGRSAVSGDVGVALLDAQASPGLVATARTQWNGSLRGAAQLGERLSLGAGYAASPFDEVAATIRSGVRLDAGDVDVSLRLPGRVSLGAVAGLGAVTGGAEGDNARWLTAGSVRWQQSRAASLALRTRAFGHERRALDGYFSPRRFQLTELAVHYERPRDLGWVWSGDAALGSQRLRFAAGAEPAQRAAWSVGAALGYRARPGVEWMLRALIANVASPGTVLGDAEYRYGSVGVGGRWLF